jgi:hypothetical protein
MVFFELDYLDYVRAEKSGFAEFEVDETKPHTLAREFPKCPSCQTPIGDLSWLPPHFVTLTTKKFGDLCTDGDAILFSERFRRAWEASGMSGLMLWDEPVQARMRRNSKVESMPTYFVAKPTCVCIRMNEESSGLLVDELIGCDRCRVSKRKKVDRIRVDEGTWGSEDIFRPSGLYGVVLVTECFVDFVEQNGFTNFHFIHQDDYSEPRNGPKERE